MAEVVVLHHAPLSSRYRAASCTSASPGCAGGADARPGARGAVLCYSALPLGEWGDNWPATWPDGVRLQLHILDGDEDYEIAQRLAATVPEAELSRRSNRVLPRGTATGARGSHLVSMRGAPTAVPAVGYPRPQEPCEIARSPLTDSNCRPPACLAGEIGAESYPAAGVASRCAVQPNAGAT
jgi:hypothetical protein